MANAIVSLLGRLVYDPEVKHTPKGTKMVRFKLAVTQGWGENKTTGWYGVTAFGHSVTFVGDYCRKGDEVWVTGELTAREVDGENGKRLFLDVTASNVAKTSPSKRKADDDEGFGGGEPSGSAQTRGGVSESDLPF